MADHYTCVMELEKIDGGFDWANIEFASSIPDLNEKSELEYDLYDALEENEKKIQELPDGYYRITVWGNVWCEEDRDWESGLWNGDWIFEWDEPSIIPINLEKETPKEVIL